MASSSSQPHRSIGDVFYETRVLMGREFTLQRFAQEVMEGAVEPGMLGYIEKGQRFPNEALVRRLAVIRDEDERDLLTLLTRDRVLGSVGKELRKLLGAPRGVKGIHDAELAVRVSRAIAALPDDGTWVDEDEWRREFRAAPKRQKDQTPLSEDVARRVESVLEEQGLVERGDAGVRRIGRHYGPRDPEGRLALALEYCVLFLKGLLDELVLADKDTGTYLRNHYLNIERDRLPEFRKRLDGALRSLAEEFAVEPGDETEFLNVLTTATPYRGVS